MDESRFIDNLVTILLANAFTALIMWMLHRRGIRSRLTYSSLILIVLPVALIRQVPGDLLIVAIFWPIGWAMLIWDLRRIHRHRSRES